MGIESYNYFGMESGGISKTIMVLLALRIFAPKLCVAVATRK